MKKVLISGIVGGIVYFLLGWLFYGYLLTDFMAANSSPGVMKTMDQMVWGPLVASNLLFGILMAYVLIGVGNITSSSKGAITAAVTALLLEAAVDLGFFATFNVYTGYNIIVADIAIVAVMSAIVGAIVVMIGNKVK